MPAVQWEASKSFDLQISLISLSILWLSSSPVLNKTIRRIRKVFFLLSLSQRQQNHNSRSRKKASLQIIYLSFIFHRTYPKLSYLFFLHRKQALVYFPFKQPSDELQLQNTPLCQNTLEELELQTQLRCTQLQNGCENGQKFPLSNICNTL